MQIISENAETNATAGWLQSAITDVTRFTQNRKAYSESENEMVKLFSNRYWTFPDPIRTLIGTGHTLYDAEGYLHSDVGYTNNIWLMGIIGVIFMYGLLIKLAFNSVRSNISKVFTLTAVYTISAFFVFNIKGQAMGYNPGAISILTFLFCMNWEIKRKRNYNRLDYVTGVVGIELY